MWIKFNDTQTTYMTTAEVLSDADLSAYILVYQKNKWSQSHVSSLANILSLVHQDKISISNGKGSIEVGAIFCIISWRQTFLMSTLDLQVDEGGFSILNSWSAALKTPLVRLSFKFKSFFCIFPRRRALLVNTLDLPVDRGGFSISSSWSVTLKTPLVKV